MKVGGLANLSLDRPIPKVPSCEKECGTAYIVQTTRPYRSICHFVKVRHRFYEPHHFDTKATPVHIDCQNLALAFNKKGAEPIAVDTSFHDGRKCFWINDNLRCPIVAFSVDARHTAIGKLVPEEKKTWNLGVMLHLHPRLILICKAWYNTSNELGFSDTIHQFDMNDNISARYLNRIGKHTRCKIDGKISCLSAPDRIRMDQLSATVTTRLRKLTMDLPPVVSLGASSSVSGRSRKRDCYSISVDPVSRVKKVVKRSRRCLPKHKVVVVRNHGPLDGEMFLFPYELPLTPEGMAKFARIEPNKLMSFLRKLGEKCPLETYNELLDTFSSESVFLFVCSIGDKGASLVENDGLAGHVEAESHSHHDKRNGKVIAQWAPILDNKRDSEYNIDEIDGIFNVDVLFDIVERTYGTQVAKRSSVKSVGSNQYSDKSCVAQDVRPRLGMSDIPDAETYRESMDPLLLPLILKIFSNLSEHSIDAARVADPVLHYILMDFFAKSSRAEEIINGLNPSELFTTLKLLTGPDRVVKGYGNTNHKDVNDELLGKLRVAILDYLQENLEFCKDKLNDPASEESEKNDVLKALTSIRHVIRGGKLDKESMPKLAPKASCGYLCRWKGPANMRPLAYFVYTESRTAVEIPRNRLAYNVFDSMREHQTTVPVVTDGEYVYVNHPMLCILAWGCGKSQRRCWFENTVSDATTGGRFTLENFIQNVVNNGAENQAVQAGYLTQQRIDDWLASGGLATNNNG